MIITPKRLRKGGGSSKTQPRVVSDGTARMYDTSVKKSEKRTPALTASQTGSFGHRQSVMAWASANAAHWPAERRRRAVSRPAGTPEWNTRNHVSGANQAIKKRAVSSKVATQR